MEQSINSFLDNENLTIHNSLTHLLDFDDDYSDLTNSIRPSMYYSEEDFMSELNPKSCTIMSLNCQSLHAKFTLIEILLDTFAANDTPIQVLCLQETWFENSNQMDLGLYHIENYHLITKNRYASAHGGLAFYIHNNWNYMVKSDTDDSPYWEELLVQVTDPSNPKSKFNVVNFYRPPHASTSNLTDFIYYFTQKLSTLNTSETTFACGDFNINLLSLNNNEHHNAYLEGIFSSGFLPTITLPTRLSNKSTLIDNIFVNKQEKLNFAGILNNEISDHQAIVNDLNVVLPPQRTVYVTIFSNSEHSIQSFKNDFECKNIYERLNKDLNADPNENYAMLEAASLNL